MFSADLGGQSAPPFAGTQFLAVGTAAAQNIIVYPWSSSTGFGAKFPDPSSFTGGQGAAISFTPSGNAVAVFGGGSSDPKNPSSFRLAAYPWSTGGFGTKFSDPSFRPQGNCRAGAFSSSGAEIVFGGEVGLSPAIFRMLAYSWSGSGFGASLAYPSTAISGSPTDFSFTPSNNAIAVAQELSPFISAYVWSSSGFGAKFSDPASLPMQVQAESCAFNPSGNALAVAHYSNVFLGSVVSVYNWSGSGFGSRFSNPATVPTGVGSSVAFSPSGDALAVGCTDSPFILAYPWSGSGFGTKFNNPTTLPPAQGRSCAFSPDGGALAVTHASSPYITVYNWSSGGFGAKFSDPATLPSTTGLACTFGVIP